MINKYVKGLIAIIVPVIFSAAVHAVPISYILETVDASGTLDGQIFGAARVTFTLYADTDDVGATCCADSAVVASSATVQLDNGPVLDILTSVGLYQFGGGFGMWHPENSNLLDERTLVIDLTVATPTTGVLYKYLQWSFAPQIDTSGGILDFDDRENVQGTYTAITSSVPLPGVISLMLVGFGGLVGVRYKAKP